MLSTFWKQNGKFGFRSHFRVTASRKHLETERQNFHKVKCSFQTRVAGRVREESKAMARLLSF